MDDLPPDPYLALGLPRTTDAAAIKTAYRKLALKYHPDKVQGKEDEFVRIQQAYEILGDESKRQHYNDQFRLAELKKNLSSRKRGSTGTSSLP